MDERDRSGLGRRLRRSVEPLEVGPLDIEAAKQRGMKRKDRRRAVTVSVSAVIVILGVAFPVALLLPLDGGQPITPPASSSPGKAVETSGRFNHGTTECTVSFPSSVVYPGAETGATATVRNLSNKVESVGISSATLLIRDSSGKVLTDTTRLENMALGGAMSGGKIAPGESEPVGTWDAHVIWPGTLSVTPDCGGTALPAVELQVVNPGKSPPDDQSVREAVAAAGAPFADCAPTEINQWVTGIIHRGAPPSDESFSARCGGLVLENPGFDTVVLAIVSPPQASSVDLEPLAEHLDAGPYAFQGDKGESIAVSWWVYVVTRDRVTRVGQYTVSQNCEGLGGGSGPGLSSCRFPTGGTSTP